MSAAAPVSPPDIPGRVALSVLLPFAVGYFLSYVFRSVNAVISPDLIAGFSLTAADLGLLTGVYFLAFAAIQLPVGILLDRYGPRRTNAALLLVAGTGALVFSASESFAGLLAGRALIGCGVGACLMSSIKAFTLWFPLHRLPAMTGWILFSGGLGAMAATTPVELALQITDWRGVFLVAAALTFIASAAIFFVVPERESAERKETLREQLSGVTQIFRTGFFWRVSLSCALLLAVNMAVQGLWAGPWLADVAGLDRPAVALHLLALAAATMIGYLSWGVAASRLNRFGMTPLALFKLGAMLFLGVQGLLALGVTTGASLLWIAFGLSGTASSLAYSVLSHAFPVSMTGRATTAVNLLIFLAAFACQWAFGAIISVWPSEAGRYHPDGYRAAFAVFFTLQLLAFAWLMLGTQESKTGGKVPAALS